MHEEHVLATEFVANLARRFDERLAFDVTDSATDFGDDDVWRRFALGARLGLQTHAALDFVRDVRNDLNRVAEVFPASFARDDLRVDLARRDVRGLSEIDVEKPLVVADVEVGLGAIIRHEDFAVLERVHRARIDVEVGVQFLHDHAESASGEQITETRGRKALAERRYDTPGYEDVFGNCRFRFVHHGVSSYLTQPSVPLDSLRSVAT